MLRSLVGSEMCIRDRVSTQSTGVTTTFNGFEGVVAAMALSHASLGRYGDGTSAHFFDTPTHLSTSGVSNPSEERIATRRELQESQRIQELTARLEQEQQRCSQLMARCTEAEDARAAAQRARDDGMREHRGEVSALERSLRQAEQRIAEIAQLKVEAETKLEQQDLVERRAREESRAALAEQKMFADRLEQRLDQMGAENESLRTNVTALTELLDSEMEELGDLTDSKNELEKNLTLGRQQVAVEQAKLAFSAKASAESLSSAELRFECQAGNLLELEKQLLSVTKELVLMKAAVASTLKHCEKNAADHAAQIRQYEALVEEAKHACDSEVKRLGAQAKELELSLASSTREIHVLTELNAEQAVELDRLRGHGTDGAQNDVVVAPTNEGDPIGQF
eukprot:TRINITY_DN38045_c0_g1_i1.p1 TRINITY_DN38045_c0_g1~~TRINITY_DN38045_c0_g1_i1.p1  ORF type:complete len:396 (+),score=133.96 TRINITY_DN38045_c0_g1_i1:93-1280(+)